MAAIIEKMTGILDVHKDLPSKTFQSLLQDGQLEKLLSVAGKVEASLGKDAQTQLRVAQLAQQFALPAESRDGKALFDKALDSKDKISACIVNLVEINTAASAKYPWLDADQLQQMSMSLQGSLKEKIQQVTDSLARRKAALKDLCVTLQALEDAAKNMDAEKAKPTLLRLDDGGDLSLNLRDAVQG